MSVSPSAACPSSAARSHSASGETTPASNDPCERTRSGTNGDMARPSALELELRVLDQADGVAIRIGHDADADAVAHVLHRVERLGPRLGHALPRRVAVLHAPVDDDAAIAGLMQRRLARHQPELVARDVEADVERLVEVGLDAERAGVPALGGGDVGNG